MKNQSKFNCLKAIVLFAAISVGITATAQKKTKDSPEKTAVALAYKFSSDKAVNYLSKGKIVQTMDINGQQMDVTVVSSAGCSVKLKGPRDNNLLLEVTIDSMYQNIDSPQGSIGGVIADAKGKVFTMLLSREGKEVDLSEAKKVVFNIESSGQTDAAQSFVDFFPDMPAGSVSPGYKWSSVDTVKTGTGTSTSKQVVKSENSFDGFEEVNGVRCAKISSVIAGTRVMTSQVNGMDIKTSGDFTGTGVVYFLPDEGYFLKQTVTSKLTGTIEITAPDNMSFPLIMDITQVTEVKK